MLEAAPDAISASPTGSAPIASAPRAPSTPYRGAGHLRVHHRRDRRRPHRASARLDRSARRPVAAVNETRGLARPHLIRVGARATDSRLHAVGRAPWTPRGCGPDAPVSSDASRRDARRELPVSRVHRSAPDAAASANGAHLVNDAQCRSGTGYPRPTWRMAMQVCMRPTRGGAHGRSCPCGRRLRPRGGALERAWRLTP
jgi:hypothetical protein